MARFTLPTLVLCFATARAVTQVSLSVTQVASGSKEPINVTISTRDDHTIDATDMIYVYAKETADSWDDTTPGTFEPMLAYAAVPTTDPAITTFTPILPSAVSSALSLPADSAFPDGEYCVIFAIADSWVKKGDPACYTIGTADSTDLQDAIDDAVAEGSGAIIAAIVGGVVAGLLIIILVVVMKVKKAACFAAKTASATAKV